MMESWFIKRRGTTRFYGHDTYLCNYRNWVLISITWGRRFFQAFNTYLTYLSFCQSSLVLRAGPGLRFRLYGRVSAAGRPDHFHPHAASLRTPTPTFQHEHEAPARSRWFHEAAKHRGSATKALGLPSCAASIRRAQGYQLHLLLPSMLFVQRPKEVTSITILGGTLYIRASRHC